MECSKVGQVCELKSDRIYPCPLAAYSLLCLLKYLTIYRAEVLLSKLIIETTS